MTKENLQLKLDDSTSVLTFLRELKNRKVSIGDSEKGAVVGKNLGCADMTGNYEIKVGFRETINGNYGNITSLAIVNPTRADFKKYGDRIL